MKIVYVAGPFTGKDHWEIAQNVRRAEELGMEVAKLGAMPLIPHTNTHNFHGTMTEAFWYAGTMELLKRADAIILAPEWEKSKGTRAELTFAKGSKTPVLHGVRALARWLASPDLTLGSIPLDEALRQTRMKRDANGDWVCECGVLCGSGMEDCLCGKKAPPW